MTEIAPNNLNAQIQHANMLLKTGQIDKAEKHFQELVVSFPDAIQGYTGLMRIARIQANWPIALRIAQSVLDRCEPHQPLFAQTARIMIFALIRLNRIEEAEETVKAFAKRRLPDEEQFLLTATLLQEQHRWTDSLAWYQRYEEIVMAKPHLVFKYLNIVLRCGFPSQAYNLLKQSLHKQRQLQNKHRFQFISILERIGKEKLAFRWLSLLVANQGPGILNQDMFIMLATAFLKGRQYERFFSLIRQTEATAPLSPRLIKCKFAALFYKALANHLNEHHMTSESAKAVKPYRSDLHLRDQLDEQIRSLRTAAGYRQTATALDGFVLFYQQIEERFFPDQLTLNTFSNPWECYRLAYFLIDRIRRRQPTALIRLGDCEGNFLPYPEHYRHQQTVDRQTCELHWWERKLSLPESDRISAELMNAIDAADIIGIPEPNRVIFDLPIPTPPELSGISRNWRGILAIFHHLASSFTREKTMHSHPRLLTASFINYDMELWGGYDLIMETARTCSVICCHPEIATSLRDRFHVELRQVILIPPEEKFAHRSPQSFRKCHFPDFFEQLSRTLTVSEPGELFLVAAGILGKSYCTWIKQKGGIALDIGSMVDIWCGSRTRKNSMHARASLGQSIRKQSLDDSRRPDPSYRYSSSLLWQAARDLEKYHFSSFFRDSPDAPTAFCMAQPRLTHPPRTPKLTITLTSYPPRINTLFLVIESLMRQTLLPDRIVLWLAENQFPLREIPATLSILEKRGMEIYWCSDLGPYKKLIPSLKLFPDEILVTVDDDLIYPPEFLESLYLSFQEHPGAIHCPPCTPHEDVPQWPNCAL